MAEQKTRQARIGNTIINLDRILYAKQDPGTRAVAIHFGGQQGEILRLDGEEAAAFWKYYSAIAADPQGKAGVWFADSPSPESEGYPDRL